VVTFLPGSVPNLQANQEAIGPLDVIEDVGGRNSGVGGLKLLVKEGRNETGLANTTGANKNEFEPRIVALGKATHKR